MTQTTIEVVVTADSWDVGGKLYKNGDKLTINAKKLVEHVSAGRCVPVGREKEFARLRELQVKAGQAEARAIAEAEAEVARLTGEIASTAGAAIGEEGSEPKE